MALPAVNGKTRHHVAGVSLLPTDVNSAPVTAFIWVICLHNVSLIDEYIRVNVGCVHPLAREVLR